MPLHELDQPSNHLYEKGTFARCRLNGVKGGEVSLGAVANEVQDELDDQSLV